MSTAQTDTDDLAIGDAIQVKLQVHSDDTNLDAHEGVEVWTRSSDEQYQTWNLAKVGEGIFRMSCTEYPEKFLTAVRMG
jgi:hypothetical protein